jgi:hypothetical protein
MEAGTMRAGAVFVACGVLLVGGFVLSVADSGDRPLFDTSEACRELSRTTLTSIPVSASHEPRDAVADDLVMFYGRAARRVARMTRTESTRDLMLAYADAASSRTWTSRAAWEREPAQVELRTLCEPYNRAAPVVAGVPRFTQAGDRVHTAT